MHVLSGLVNVSPVTDKQRRVDTVNTVEQMSQALQAMIDSSMKHGRMPDTLELSAAIRAINEYNTAKERESQDEKCMLHSERIRYQGWANYETWAMALELSNDEDSYNTCCGLVESAGSVYDGAQELQRHYETLIDEVLSCWSSGGDYGSKKRHMEVSDIPFYGLYTASLSAVDWYEVARSFKPDEWGDSDTAPEDTEDEDTDE